MTFAKRSLGQNFLSDPNYRRKIATAALNHVGEGDTILEIGPGRGALSDILVASKRPIILVEKDDKLALSLAQRYVGRPGLEIINTDFLEIDITSLSQSPLVVIGNLPYNISTQILIELLKNFQKAKALILMFQKEVAQRCVAKPGCKDFGPLAIWCSLFSQAKIIFDVPPSAFLPRPKITSSVVEFLPSGLLYDEGQQKFIDFARKLFTHRRKKISNNIKSLVRVGPEFDDEAKKLLDRRGESLTLDEMRKLYSYFIKPNKPSNLP